MVVSSTEIARECLRANELVFSSRKHSAAISCLLTMMLPLLGPYWRFVKKLSKHGEAVNVTEELMKLTNNVISQMMLGIRCSGMEDEAETARRQVREVTKIFGEFNLADLIWFCKNLDVQGFRKRYEDTHRGYDGLLEKIISDRVDVRKQKRKEEHIRGLQEVAQHESLDLLDMLLDILEDEKAEMKLTRENIKAVILVSFAIVLFLVE
ncbi:Cytochrome P450 [Dillenia turbinata]|uniref:Cytochrome P450 n=1 Tax=Dillenia turbinata TaxID=194707 RepID=A0AAN8V8J1_9MAGN